MRRTPQKAVAHRKFKFTIVMCVYNTESWLTEAIESIINQDIGFEDNVQLILVNDGSIDSSDDICKEFQKKFPSNIIYVRQENSGPSRARNVGIDLAQGKYINFLDSDDKISSNTLSEVYDFFEHHRENIDLVSIKIEFFEARSGPHMLNYKFERDNVIDITEKFQYVQLSAASSFFKSEVFQKTRFDENLRVSEDTKLISTIVCKKMKYGVLKEPTYYYRRRVDESSIINNRFKDAYWYEYVIPNVYQYLIDWSLSQYGKVLKYIQFLVLYDLQGQLMSESLGRNVLSEKQYKTYKERIFKLLDCMDDDVILRQKKLKREYKYQIMSNKHKESVITSAEVKNRKVYYRGIEVYDYDDSRPVIRIINIEQQGSNKTIIKFRYTGFFFSGVSLAILVNDIEVNATKSVDPALCSYMLGDLIHDKNQYQLEVGVWSSNIQLKARISIGGDTIDIPIKYSSETRIDGEKQTNIHVKDSKYLVLTYDTRGEYVCDIVYLPRMKNRLDFQSSANLQLKKNKNRILYTGATIDGRHVVVYTKDYEVHYYVVSDSKSPYEMLVNVRAILLHASFYGRKLSLYYSAYIINPYNVQIDEQYLYLDETNKSNISLQQTQSMVSNWKMLQNHRLRAKFMLEDITRGKDVPINSTIKVKLLSAGKELNYVVYVRNRNISNELFYYLPIIRTRFKDRYVHLRSNSNRSLILVRRKMEDVEKSLRFRLLESSPVSSLLYVVGKVTRKLSSKNVNLYYEKFASKAEEGAFELFLRANQAGKNSYNYYVIDRCSSDYAKVKGVRRVVYKYSFRYYALLYRANNLISTEAPAHINVLRNNNKHLRRSLYEKGFIFLQHGIIYMKNLGKTSVFGLGKDSEPNYMIVSSKKEREVVANMLRLPRQRLLVTGLAMFDNSSYESIKSDSEDIVTIMLTWKHYEEHIEDFTETSYYKNTVAIAKLVRAYLPKKNIRIVAHPRVASSLQSTKLGNIWDKSISEAVRDSKLLITDYSSICYYAFYQGSAVIFFQPDLVEYEEYVGKLVPRNFEYIGLRAFSVDELRDILDKSVRNRRLENMNLLRNSEHEAQYELINEFHDGKNIDRIVAELDHKNII